MTWPLLWQPRSSLFTSLPVGLSKNSILVATAPASLFLNGNERANPSVLRIERIIPKTKLEGEFGYALTRQLIASEETVYSSHPKSFIQTALAHQDLHKEDARPSKKRPNEKVKTIYIPPPHRLLTGIHKPQC